MQGRFGDNNELLFEVDLMTKEGLKLTVDAMLDTGFSGGLALDLQDLEGLDYQYIGTQDMQLAKGEKVEFSLYFGKLYLDEREFEILIHAALGVPEVLLGRQWLIDRRLTVEMRSQLLTLEESQD
ncbi:MAG: aspartyl protease [Spirulina sp.]